ncbi:MAG: ral secretion pathway protein [Candidatus Sumerlaeota bacterium]|nr:ral secretion pathway protein [Candidatus Sumerlaeota bacterium]
MNRFSSAFTLIELLVVVAVIAILAAIAVPNFLEAQTRSKVSRAKADMRTVATALESYRIDGNRYPPDFQFGTFSFVQRFARLTTPVSYISSIPEDPFADAGAIIEHAATETVNGYAFPATTNNLIRPFTYDYAYRFLPGGIPEPTTTWSNITRNPGNVMWAMRSAGPDRWPSYLGSAMPGYDPTNGTVSRGNIYWTGPGVGEDAPLI